MEAIFRETLLTADASPATKVRYTIEGKGSSFTVRAFATGMLSALGHNPTIAIPDLAGEVQFAPDSPEDSSLRLVIQAVSLTVTDDISDQDRREIERRMHEEVLDTDSFPEISYECAKATSAQKIADGFYSVVLNGELVMHGVERIQPVTARLTMKDDGLRAAGEFSVRLSDYDIKPVSAAGGTVKLKDELKLSFDLRARRTG
jgi:polyisoprenoid-binding protein YceI